MVKRAVACTLAMLMMLQSTSTYAASVQMTKQTVRIQSASKQINRQSKENGEIEVEFVFSKVDGSKILE
ncbi:MAG: hypothetical protein IAC13_02150, partial [Firmicutes bacterium]|nr:hypothetical protein [Candidatus Scybalomonas excrementavium]